MRRGEKDNYLYLLVIFTLLIYLLVFNYLILFLFFLLIFGCHYSFTNNGFPFIIIFFLIFLNFILIFIKLKDSIINDQFHHKATVLKSYSKSLFVKEDKNIYFISFSSYNYLIPHTKIAYDCIYKSITFDINDSFSNFLISNHCTSYGYVSDYQIISYPFLSFRNFIYAKLLSSDDFYNQFTLLLFYKKETLFNSLIKDSFERLGISFLIVISGFHIVLITKLINFVIGKFYISNRLKKIILFILINYFLYFLYFPLTGLKAMINYFLIIFPRKIKRSKYKALSITGIIFLIYNPLLILSSGLILSFLISFIIIFLNNKFKNNTIKKAIYLNLFAFFISIPFLSNWGSDLNLFAPFLIFIVTPIIEFLYSFLVLFLFTPFLWSLISYLIFIFVILFNFINLFYLQIPLFNFSFLFSIIYISFIFIVINLYFLNHR